MRIAPVLEEPFPEIPLMLSTIVRKEILENILSYRFPLFLIITGILIPISLYVNHLDYSKRVNDRNEQVRLANDALSSSRMWDIHFGTIPLKGFRPPSPLSIFATGFENSLPRFYEFQPDGFKAGETSIADESILSVIGKLDFLFIMQMVVSLIVLLFASDLVAGEKELGTLRGILSNSVPRHSLLMGKLLGGYVAVWLPFVIAFLLGMIVLSVTSFPLSEPHISVRILVIFVSASIFILGYFTLGLMISASAARSRTALIAILLAWIVFQLVIPKASDLIASIVYPIRTETVVSMQKSLTVKTLDDEKARLLGKEYERIFGKGSAPGNNPEKSPQQDQWVSIKGGVDKQYRDRKAEQVRQLDDAHKRERTIQQSIANGLSLISPSAAFTRFVSDLCGTGELDKEKYSTAVTLQQQTLDALLYSHVDKTTLILPSGGTSSSSSIDQFVDLKSLPAFEVGKTTLSEVVVGNLGSFISLAFWLVAPFAVAYVRFLRYDVR
jgi:ABC-type transport system involved in multi-copper enzyme maturation permease subunit